MLKNSIMPRCPYCNEWFKTNQGLKTHITKAHTSEILGQKFIDPFKIGPFSPKKKK